MAETGEATISQLNNIAALGLDNKYKGKRNGLETLSKNTLSIDELI